MEAVSALPKPSRVTIRMRKVELGTFSCGRCEVVFEEDRLYFWAEEGHEPPGDGAAIIFEYSGLTRLDVDEKSSVLCVTGFFPHEIEPLEQHYQPFSNDGSSASRPWLIIAPPFSQYTCRVALHT